MPTLETYFEQVPVEVVKKIAQPLPNNDVEHATQDWRDLARLIQKEADPNKMIKLVERMLQTFDEEKRRTGGVGVN